jgi:hypothetical protein
MTVIDIPNQSICVALCGSLYLISAQAMIPPMTLKRRGSSHHAQEVRSTAISVLLSLRMGAPHSEQYKAFGDILAPQAPQECKDLPQYWQ